MSANLQRCAGISDLRDIARRRLPKALFDFIDGGAGAEDTLGANMAAFKAWSFAPRVGVNVAERSTRASILSRPSRLPLVIAPTGFAGLLHPDGEIGMASAARDAGIPFCLSTNSIASLEELAQAVPGCDLWFQIYFLKDRAWLDALVERAGRAGYGTLCVTMDLPIAGRRERDVRNAFTVPLRPTLGNAGDLALRWRWLAGARRTRFRFGNFETMEGPTGFVSIAQHVANLFDPSATWDDLARLRDGWKGRLAVKGILAAEDVRKAFALGADAVIVSNHGGRQLDGSLASLDALDEARDVVEDGRELIVDGGVRRGTDVVKAVCLGASSCMIGRAALYGLAAAGARGVAHAIALIAGELDNALALSGAGAVSALDRTLLRRSGQAREVTPKGVSSNRPLPRED